jgi:hypothetical protein
MEGVNWMRRQIVVGWAVILLPLFHSVINLFTNQIYLAGNQPHNHFYRQRQQIFSPLRAYQTSICHHRQTRRLSVLAAMWMLGSTGNNRISTLAIVSPYSRNGESYGHRSAGEPNWCGS